MLTLRPAEVFLAIGVPRYFLGSGGVAPYAYSVASGPGTINAATGLYLAPAVQSENGKDQVATIVVTDANGDTAEAEAFICTPLQLLGRIIQREMGLQDGRVYLWDQKINAPNGDGLFIAISATSPKCYSNRNRFNPETNMQEQASNWSTDVDVDIISRGPEARDRKEEVVMALLSQHSVQQQELNSFSLSAIPSSIRNLSGIDGTAIPYRFNFSMKLLYEVNKITLADYFDTFEIPSLVIDPLGVIPEPPLPVWAVNNLVASAITDTSLTVSWDTGTEPTNGYLRYGTDPENLDQEIEIPIADRATSHSFPITGLAPNTQYYFQVDAVDVYGQEHQAEIEPHTLPVWNIENFAAGNPQADSIDLTWDTTGYPTSSVIRFGTDPMNLDQEYVDPAAPSTVHAVTIPGLLSGTLYYFEVDASDDFGQEETSPQVSETTL